MNKPTLTGLIIAAILVGLGIFALVNTADEASNEIDTNITTNQENDQVDEIATGADSQPTLPEAIYEGAYRVTGTVTNADDSTANGTIILSFESNDSWSLTLDGDEGKIETIFSEGYTYLGGEDGYTRFPANDSNQEDLSLDNFSISQDQLDRYKQDAEYRGMDSCNVGSCDLFVFNETLQGQEGEARIWIDSANGRVAQWEFMDDQTTSSFVYEYNPDIKVTAPSDFTDFEIPGQ